MALINCPECNMEISDKVKICPHCYYPFEEEVDNNKPQKVELISVKFKSKKHKKIILLGLIAVTIVSILFFGLKTLNYKIAYNSYVDNLMEAQAIMLTGGADAETLLNLTSRVWYDAIYEKDNPDTRDYVKPDGVYLRDFNIALSNLLDDKNTLSKKENIESNQKLVKDLMKRIQNPPKGLERSHETVEDLYATYKGITNLALNPSGSLDSFSQSKNEKIDNFMELYDKLDTQIP